LHDEYSVTSYPITILLDLQTIQFYPQTLDTLQSDFIEPFEETISADDVESILNKKSIHQAVVDLINNLTLGKVTTISFIENHDLAMKDGRYMISYQQFVLILEVSSP
jgi:hypothetical protein